MNIFIRILDPKNIGANVKIIFFSFGGPMSPGTPLFKKYCILDELIALESWNFFYMKEYAKYDLPTIQ